MSNTEIWEIAHRWDHLAREYANVIGGYAQMLADPYLDLGADRRMEFAERIYAAQIAMTEMHASYCRLLALQPAD